jgi:hypothetical protein
VVQKSAQALTAKSGESQDLKQMCPAPKPILCPAVQ